MIDVRSARVAAIRLRTLVGVSLPAAGGRGAAALLVLLAVGCSRSEESESARQGLSSPSPEGLSSAGEGVAAESKTGTHGKGPLVVFLGDSLTAGLGLGEEEAYPALVGAELERRGAPIRVVNAGVSGDTSAGGLARLDWLLRQRPDLLFVELGANDGLRGQPVEAIEANLRAIVERTRAAGAEVVLAGMKIPPNYGPDYTAEFEAIYTGLADELDLATVPFLLEGVAANPELNLPDGLHPNAAGHRILATTVADAIEPLLRRISARAQRAA